MSDLIKIYAVYKFSYFRLWYRARTLISKYSSPQSNLTVVDFFNPKSIETGKTLISLRERAGCSGSYLFAHDAMQFF